MDGYTQKTKVWLDERFRKCNEQGIYYAHQPIYGLLRGYSEIRPVNKHIITYHIMQALSHLQFNTLVDIGGAEGFKVWVVQKIFGATVVNADLSDEACKRSREIFHIDSVPVDIHQLPFKNNKFEVVLCSETIEHASDLHKAVHELLRVAGKAVIITVPHENREVVEKVRQGNIPHGHLHHFDLDTFTFLEAEGYTIMKKRMISPVLKKFSIYRLGRWAAALQILTHDFVCRLTPRFDGIVFVIVKDPGCWCKRSRLSITPGRILDLTVPFHYLNKRNN